MRFFITILVFALLFLYCCKRDGTSPVNEGTGINEGDFSQFVNLSWIDSHVHLRSHRRISDYVAYQDRFGMSRMVLLCPPNASALRTGGRPNDNAEALLAKALHPGRFYVFGGPDLSALASGGAAALSADLEIQVNELANAGADGIKLFFPHAVVDSLNGPPFNFTYLPDNVELAKLFQTAAARSLPILIHIDGMYLANLDRAISLSPDVTWIVTHLAFAGSDVSSLQAMLEAKLAAGYNVYLDVGHFVHLGELMLSGSAAGEFLNKHCDRIFQSSDLASGCENWGLTDDECPSEEMAVGQAWKLRALLESTQEISFTSAFTGRNVTVRSLGLPQATLKSLYHDAVYSVLGEPKQINCAAAQIHINRLIGHTTLADDTIRLREIRSLMTTVCP